jgi:simple sugar transport system ATP-binding protein
MEGDGLDMTEVEPRVAEVEPRKVVLSATGISKRYGTVQALQRVAIDIYAGEVLGLVGDNGAGKSTLVRILSGADYADEGTVTFEGKTVELSSPGMARRLGIETVYQDLALAPHLSVPANLFLGRELRRGGFLGKLGFMAESAMRSRAKESLASLHIELKNIQSSVQLLSGGQRQSVAIARAAEWARLVMILDEPTAALGVEQSGEVLMISRRAADRGLGVLFISHTLPYVMEVCDRIVVLRHGEVVGNIPTAKCTLEDIVALITGARAAALGETGAVDEGSRSTV